MSNPNAKARRSDANTFRGDIRGLRRFANARTRDTRMSQARKIKVRDRVYNVDVQDSWEIGPRFGGTYVLTSDEKNVVRANWGRVADLPQPPLVTAGVGDLEGVQPVERDGAQPGEPHARRVRDELAGRT